MKLVSLTFNKDKERATVQLVYLNCIRTRSLWRRTRAETQTKKSIMYVGLQVLCGFLEIFEDIKKMDVNNTSNIPKPEFVNQDVLEFKLMYSTTTGVLGLEPRETPIHTSGYSCSGATTIWNTLTGLGRGKSKCCNH